eukprot:2571159-Pyramimonas_sp.AAC.1
MTRTSIPVITSPAAPLQPELVHNTDSTSQNDSSNTTSFTDLVRTADRVPSSGFDERTRLTSSNRFL